MARRQRESDDHPFFDRKAGCRKTAWDTPKCLSDDDWAVSKGLIYFAELGGTAFLDYLRSLSEVVRIRLFNHVLGWPEGLSYTRSAEYVVTTFYPGFMQHLGPKLKSALAAKV